MTANQMRDNLREAQKLLKMARAIVRPVRDEIAGRGLSQEATFLTQVNESIRANDRYLSGDFEPALDKIAATEPKGPSVAGHTLIVLGQGAEDEDEDDECPTCHGTH
jgi:hypothetical protein